MGYIVSYQERGDEGAQIEKAFATAVSDWRDAGSISVTAAAGGG